MLDFRKIFQCYVSPILTNINLAIVSTYCLMIYYFDVAQEEIKLPCFAYSLMIANSLAGLTKLIQDNTFFDLRILLDYAQLILALPLITTDFLITQDIFSDEISGIPLFIGFTALVLFIIFEYKRQDLTDLTLILSIFLYGAAGIARQALAFCAALVFASAYFGFKRSEVCLKNQDRSNICMAVFAFLSLAAFEPEKLLTIPSALDMTLIAE